MEISKKRENYYKKLMKEKVCKIGSNLFHIAQLNFINITEKKGAWFKMNFLKQSHCWKFLVKAMKVFKFYKWLN